MFQATDVPDLSGKNIVITGGNSGIGFEAARVLTAKRARVVLACRDKEKMKAAADAVRKETAGALVDEIVLDLSSLASIRAGAQELGRYPQLDVLINNAGVMALPERTTADGFEMQFGTNHLGPYALTGLVLPLVLAAPAGRVVTVSSFLHKSGHIELADIPKHRSYDTKKAYAMSKLANVLFTYELERRLRAAGSRAKAIACHPGYSATNLQGVGPQMTGAKLKGLFMSIANALVAQPATMGCLPTLYASVGELDGGLYVGPTGMFDMRGYPKVMRSSPESYDLDVARALWEVSEKLTGVAYAFASPPNAVARSA